MINVLFCIFIDALLHSHFVHQTTDIFSICRNFGRIRLRFKARLVIADPMQYLLNPIGKIRKVRSISRTGECTNPSRLSSITASFSRDFIIPVDVLKKFRFISIVNRSVFFLFTRVIRSKRISSDSLSVAGEQWRYYLRKSTQFGLSS